MLATVVCSHGESISGGMQRNTMALMYKMRERMRPGKCAQADGSTVCLCPYNERAGRWSISGSTVLPMCLCAVLVNLAQKIYSYLFERVFINENS